MQQVANTSNLHISFISVAMNTQVQVQKEITGSLSDETKKAKPIKLFFTYCVILRQNSELHFQPPV